MSVSVIYRFDRHVADAERRELRYEDRSIEIQPKVLDLILYLIGERHRVVPKQELLDRLWTDAAVVDSVLSTAIHAARVALGDSASQQRYIKTSARLGYRFVAEISESIADSQAVTESTPSLTLGDALWGGILAGINNILSNDKWAATAFAGKVWPR